MIVAEACRLIARPVARLLLLLSLVFLLVGGSSGQPARADDAAPKVWEVGPNKPLHLPSEAAAKAGDGDTVRIDPGDYFDCAAWGANQLTIEGTGPGVVITDKTCQGKALFITRGQGTTIRNITFARARVPDGNGAGIRSEGRDLTVENSTFTNNEVAILAASAPGSELTITGSTFQDNGQCRDSRCIGTLLLQGIAVLRIAQSNFRSQKGETMIESQALRSELTDDQFDDGTDGTLTHFISIDGGGSLTLERSTLLAGPSHGGAMAAVLLGLVPHGIPDPHLRFVGNHLTNDSGNPATFVLNWTGTDIEASQNLFTGGDVSEESTSGYWFHWAGSWFHWVITLLHQIKDAIWHLGGLILRLVHRG